jgi:alpha-beta hydrolase superfamily lysophospholipase
LDVSLNTAGKEQHFRGEARNNTMSAKNPNLSRRALLRTVVVGIATGAIPLEPSVTPAASPASQGNDPSTSAKPEIWSHDYWAKKDNVSLYMFRKRMGEPQPGNSLPVLFLAHGSSVSSRPTYDLHVPGHGEYSLMDKFAEYGFDVWTMDFEGYGRSSRTDGNSDIASGVEDLKVAANVILRETGQKRFHLYGESSGALRAGAFAMARPDCVGRMVFVSLTWTGQGSPTLTGRAALLDYYRTHNTRPRDRAMINSIFTRDKPGTSDKAVAEAMADAELRFGDSVPTGTYLDMITKLPLVDPARLSMPVLIARGEYDGIATEDDVLNFFKNLKAPEREFVVLPGASHAVALGINRRQLWYVMKSFLDSPARQDL